MSREIKLNCCEGQEKYEGACLRDRCPIYSSAQSEVNANWPWVPTGFGNLYGYPTHGHYLGRVMRDINSEPKKVK